MTRLMGTNILNPDIVYAIAFQYLLRDELSQSRDRLEKGKGGACHRAEACPKRP